MFISFHADPSLMPFEMRRRAWQHAREEARHAYEAWSAATTEPERAAAFAIYRAAEEREAAAAKAFGVS